MALGFEPRTACLEGRCSIQLSYATMLWTRNYATLFNSACKLTKIMDFVSCKRSNFFLVNTFLGCQGNTEGHSAPINSSKI